jgi:hypothetical protein
MTRMPDKTRFLVQAATQRHEAMLARVNDFVDQLDRSGQPVTFCAVAAGAAVSRAWLYREPDVRDLIKRVRSTPSRSATVPTAQRATAESLRARLDGTQAEITRLRAENAVLRDQVARQFGEQRAEIRHIRLITGR